MEKILVSKCLLGENVNYRGGNAFCEHPLIKQWLAEGRIISVCPEVQAGLPIPRPPSEIVGSGGGVAVLANKARIVNVIGTDVTDLYVKGAQIALSLVQKHHIKIAILKSRSPSCGNNTIYDGSFSGTKISGEGVTAALLQQHGVKVFNEDEIEQVSNYLSECEIV